MMQNEPGGKKPNL